jgi:hypothetical protein
MDMTNVSKTPNGTTKIVLYLKDEERRQLKKLSGKLGKNDFETIKYALRLVSWWSKNEIEPED